ncbi:hypothetical protein AB0F46_29445 [Streptomyces sp. NPDC026665]|uniref:hypothetical protein n=1 Tax=Streptomyces sp. NPDC026665 TaxID=3154798 RepID=UPI0033E94A29
MSYPALFSTPGVRAFAEAVDTERQAQLAQFGDQHHPDGTGSSSQQVAAGAARARCQVAATQGEVTWQLILAEEHAEAMAESDPAALRAELVQVAAVCAAWIADLDSRTTRADHVCNSVQARGEMDETLGYLICGVCGTPRGEVQR